TRSRRSPRSSTSRYARSRPRRADEALLADEDRHPAMTQLASGAAAHRPGGPGAARTGRITREGLKGSKSTIDHHEPKNRRLAIAIRSSAGVRRDRYATVWL